PIETAPKDGSRFLAWDGERCEWAEWADYDRQDGGGPNAAPGWTSESNPGFEFNPTHWAPSPSGPTTTNGNREHIIQLGLGSRLAMARARWAVDPDCGMGRHIALEMSVSVECEVDSSLESSSSLSEELALDRIGALDRALEDVRAAGKGRGRSDSLDAVAK